MSATNGKARGRPPYRHSKAVLPKPGDEQATYTHAQLIRMDINFALASCVHSSAAKKAVRAWHRLTSFRRGA